MSTLDLTLDHVGFMLRDLDAGAERWRRLGFRLAPRSPQIGHTRPGGPIEPWATANHCAMLRDGYLELIGIHDASAFNPWTRFMDRFEGIHIVALRCDDADAAYAALRERTEGLDPPVDRRRDAPYGDGTREMRFRNIFSRDDIWPEARFIVIEHQTPEVIWQDALMEQPNGATALTEVVFRAADIAPTRDRLAALLGVPADQTAVGCALFDLPRGGRATVLDENAFAGRFPGVEPTPLPCVGACRVAVGDPDRARALLAAGDVHFTDHGDGAFWVGPEAANGAVIEFAPH